MDKMEQELNDHVQAIAYILDIEAPNTDASNEEKCLFVGKNIEEAQRIGLALAGGFEGANAWKNVVTIANYLKELMKKLGIDIKMQQGFLKS